MFILAFIFALWNFFTVWWVSNASVLGGVAAIIIGSFLPTTVFMCYDFLARRSSKFFSYSFFVVAWICAENLYMNGELAFPWLMLGSGFAQTVWAVQWYEYLGSYGGTLWVLLSNIFLYEAISARKNRLLWASTAAIIFIPILISLAIWKNYDISQNEHVTAHIVQPNFDPYTEKFKTSQSEQTEIIIDLAEQAPSNVDFIVTPETAFSDNLWEGIIRSSQSVRSIIKSIEENYPRAQFIAGATTRRRYTDAREASPTARRINGSDFLYDSYNSAVVVDTSLLFPIHHKNKLVVGVERIPYFKLLKNVDFVSINLGGIAGQLGYDLEPTIFDAPKGKFSTMICYESVYGEYFANTSALGAELIFIITNDGWWGNTLGHRQHFNFARLRAIESRRAVVRSANTGISGVISPRGEVLDSLGWDMRGTITASVPMNSKVTIYSQMGDVVVRISKLIFVLLVMLMARDYLRKRFKKNI